MFLEILITFQNINCYFLVLCFLLLFSWNKNAIIDNTNNANIANRSHISSNGCLNISERLIFIIIHIGIPNNKEKPIAVNLLFLSILNIPNIHTR